MKSVELLLEKTMYASRWLLAPIYVGLSLAVLALGIKFFQEVIHIFGHVFTIKESDLVLNILTLIDMSLVASLIVMVMFSSYENFVSKIICCEFLWKLKHMKPNSLSGTP
jgi:uncharacterized protein (TIGR00645 family)